MSVRTTSKHRAVSRVWFELLERRMLLSLSAAGAEFRANTFTAGSQSDAAIAADSNGNFVVAWSSDGQDGSSGGIYAQRYNAAGVKQGAEFRVNTVTLNAQSDPAVAMDADGDFVIAWTSSDGSSNGIFAQRYSAAGVKQGDQFRVNTTTSNAQNNAAIAMDDAGNFVVAWDASAPIGALPGVFAQRFSAAGAKVGAEFAVSPGTNQGRSPAAAMDADGDFVIAWEAASDGSDSGAFARRYSKTGQAQGSAFRVNTTIAGPQENVAAAMDDSGDFVVTWDSEGPVDTTYGVYAQRFNSAGTKHGGEFRANTFTVGNQFQPAVAMDADGDFVICWNSDGQDGSAGGIFARQFRADGTPQGSEFRVNSTTAGDQDDPSVVCDAAGNVVFSFDSAEVSVRRFNNATFASLSSGKLTVNGTSGSDTITLERQQTVLRVTRNGVPLSFNNASVTRIEVLARDGNNRVTIGEGIIGASVAGGTGKDTFVGGSGSDSLNGASGNDKLTGGAGADSLIGGKNSDSISGGDGNDTIDGQDGTDTLIGDAGRDRIRGGNGNDSIRGGNQNDSLFGDAGDDSIQGGAHDDVLDGGPGADNLNGNTGTDRSDNTEPEDILELIELEN
jgi:Ca2+-binding RTX toxin-like protein